MNRRSLLISLAALLPGITQAKKKARKYRTFTVVDRTTPDWEGVVAGVVDAFNDVMPARGPRLIYQRSDPALCASDITVCLGDTMPYLGLAAVPALGDAEIIITNQSPIDPDLQEALACHELMHALTGIRDCYGCRPDSCVHGWRRTPGTFDIAYLKKTFGKKKAKKKR